MLLYLSEECHSEKRAQKPLAGVHHLHDLGVGAVQRVIQMRQFLSTKKCFEKVVEAVSQLKQTPCLFGLIPTYFLKTLWLLSARS